MGKLTKQNSNLPTLPTKNPDKTETWAGKHTARVTKIFNQPDGSTVKATRRIKAIPHRTKGCNITPKMVQ